MARRLIERGTRFVTVNQFDTVFRHLVLGYARGWQQPEQYLR